MGGKKVVSKCAPPSYADACMHMEAVPGVRSTKNASDKPRGGTMLTRKPGLYLGRKEESAAGMHDNIQHSALAQALNRCLPASRVEVKWAM
jgi:hypothetical protein